MEKEHISDNKDICRHETNKITELIKSPDIDDRQRAVNKLTKFALNAIETDAGCEQLLNIIDGFDQSIKFNKELDEYREIITNSPNGVTISGKDGIVTFWNDSMESITGIKQSDAIGNSLFQIKCDLTPASEKSNPESLDQIKHDVDHAIDLNNKWPNRQAVEQIIELPDGTHKTLRNSSFTIDTNGDIKFCSVFQDITEMKAQEEKLIELSLFDSVTGLYNRNYFEEQGRILKNSRHSHQYPVSVISIDVDGLREVNNNFGHPKGDELLHRVGLVLKDVFRIEDCVARSGGDEFGILLPNTDKDAAAEVIDRIKQTLASHNLKDPNAPISFSIGHAVAENALTWNQTIEDADDRMYDDKKSKK